MALLMLGPVQYVFAAVWVNGYTRSDGTYVSGHYRSNPDGNPYNNWSYPGNTNPYTGVTAGGSASTYLNNYYKNSSYTSLYTPSYSSLYSGLYTSSLSSGSSYKSVTNGYESYGILFCDYGYYEKDDKCIKTPKNGYSVGSTLFCDYGYKESKGKCVKPDNGRYVGDTLYCDTGYQKKGNKCVIPKNGYMIGSTLTCEDGFYILGNSCENVDSHCKAEFGKYSIGTDDEKCTCKEGYHWNNKDVEKATKCIKDKKIKKD